MRTSRKQRSRSTELQIAPFFDSPSASFSMSGSTDRKATAIYDDNLTGAEPPCIPPAFAANVSTTRESLRICDGSSSKTLQLSINPRIEAPFPRGLRGRERPVTNKVSESANKVRLLRFPSRRWTQSRLQVAATSFAAD